MNCHSREVVLPVNGNDTAIRLSLDIACLASLRAPGATAAGGVDASCFPHLTSARPYEHRSIYRTSRFGGLGAGYGGLLPPSAGRRTAPHGATAVRTWRRRPGRPPLISPYSESRWAWTREKRRRETGAARERDAAVAHAKSRLAGAERTTRPSRRTAPTRAHHGEVHPHTGDTPLPGSSRPLPRRAAAGPVPPTPISELPPATPIWALFAR